MDDPNFRQVEEALRLRPSVFTARERTALRMSHGLTGDAPADSGAIAKALKCTRTMAWDIVLKGREKVRLVFAPPPSVNLTKTLLKGASMAKKEKHKCLFPHCDGEAVNHIGLRLRRSPGPDNVWTHDTNGYICDAHAEMGLAFTVNVSLHQNGKKIYTAVSHDGGELFERESDINPEKSPTARSK